MDRVSRFFGLDPVSRAQRRKVRRAARWWREHGLDVAIDQVMPAAEAGDPRARETLRLLVERKRACCGHP
jgi:hypothetical protein